MDDFYQEKLREATENLTLMRLKKLEEYDIKHPRVLA